MKYEIHWVKRYYSTGTFVVEADSELEAEAKGEELMGDQESHPHIAEEGEVEFVELVKETPGQRFLSYSSREVFFTDKDAFRRCLECGQRCDTSHHPACGKRVSDAPFVLECDCEEKDHE